ncbi:tumor susceptibility gene 101 protein isoform X2 [Lingula anatina]|nr:tumor susceptibility gene 101 protein isoform X2 [Lingula anatina]XP_013401999.1 tumor susceptibility gene 101 protein isoform X2 [Lingula anatina]|eukprot:XP_013401998.1 tumor susceptibility gene 101 protein isoform X2 [Lingula anatina]
MAGSQGNDAYLRNALSKYQYQHLAKRDILQALSHFKDLKPNVDSFVFNDGNRKELLCLEGTIPVTYRGTTFNIPVCLWLLETHPHNPPMVYVKPTANMQIMSGQHVDTNGKVYLSYLHEWRHPQSDLLGLIQIMCIIFGDNPPVFRKEAEGTSPRAGYVHSPIGLSHPLAGRLFIISYTHP